MIRFNIASKLGVLLFVLLSISGCEKQILILNKINEGKIVYTITYPPQASSQPFSSVLPSQMTIFFKNSSTHTVIKGPLNFFSLDVNKQYKNDSVSTYLRVLDKKVYFKAPVKGGNYLFSELNSLKALLVDGIEKEICGVKCKKALLEIDNNSIAPIEVFYSNIIDIKNPNANGPFKDIPGVMLKFDLIMNKVRYTFTATEIVEMKVEDSFFKPMKGYQMITQDEMHELITSLSQ